MINMRSERFRGVETSQKYQNISEIKVKCVENAAFHRKQWA